MSVPETIDPSAVPAHLSKVFVGNLSFKTSPAELKEWVQQVLATTPLGAECVREADILSRRGRSAGYGFLTFTNPTAASQAVGLLDKQEFAGRAVNCESATPQKPPRVPAESTSAQENVTDAAPQKPKQRRNRRKGGAAAATAVAPDATAVNADGEDQVDMATRPPRTPRAKQQRRPREPREDDEFSDTVIYVGNLPFETTDESLAAIFSEFAVIHAAIIRFKWNQRSKGFGFVTLETHEEQQRVIESLSGVTVGGRELIIKMAVAQRKAEEETA